MEDLTTGLTGTTALITGAARRRGKAMALALARQGASVVAHYNESANEARALCDQIRNIGVKCWTVQADFSEKGQAERLFAQAVEQAGPVSVLINNASIFDKETLWETSVESLGRNVSIHTLAPLILSRAMAQQGREGHIVNLLDTRVTSYDGKHAAYHLSKRALLTLTRMLAIELAPGIAVNAVAPGLILPPKGKDRGYLEGLAHTNPLERIGSERDVIDAVLFLLRSRFVTGQIIYVDGGFHMKGHMYD